MSQRSHTAKGHTFLYGYDRPLRYFFLVIEDAGTGEMIFSNLDRPGPGPGMTIEEIREEWSKHAPFPETVVGELESDREREEEIKRDDRPIENRERHDLVSSSATAS